MKSCTYSGEISEASCSGALEKDNEGEEKLDRKEQSSRKKCLSDDAPCSNTKSAKKTPNHNVAIEKDSNETIGVDDKNQSCKQHSKGSKKDFDYSKLTFIKNLGKGASSNVYLFQDTETYDLVALKKIKRTTKHITYEIEMLEKLQYHENIIELRKSFVMQDCVYIFLEAMDMNLYDLIQKRKFDALLVETILHKCLCGLSHMKKKRVLHRDIKPQNILVSEHNVKICDFGLSCVFQNTSMNSNVVTLWYRAPELLLGCTNYDFSIDLWSMMCVTVEMVKGKPPFIGRKNSDIDQLYAICESIGSPTSEQLFKMGCIDSIQLENFPDRQMFKQFPVFVAKTLCHDIHMRPDCDSILLNLKSHNVSLCDYVELRKESN